MRNELRKIGYGVLGIVFLVALFIGAIALPKTDRWKNNLDASFQELLEEGQYPRYLWASEQKWDNYTLVIFLSALQNMDAEKPITSFIKLYYQTGIQEDFWSVDDMISSENMEVSEYSRYWMGSLIIVILWLYLYPVFGLRFLLLALVLLCYFLLIKDYGISLEYIALVCATLMAFWPMNGMCLVYGSEIVLSLGSIIVYRCFLRHDRHFGAIEYAMIGAVTMFFCMLSNPLITLGMVLCLELSDQLADHNVGGLKHEKVHLALKAIGYSLAWCMGYIVLMKLKGFLTELAGGTASGSGRMLELVGTGSLLQRMGSSIYLFLRFIYPWIGIWVVLVVLLLFVIWQKAYNWQSTLYQWPLLLIGTYPFIWEMIFYGHTGHGMEANVYVITVFSIILAVLKSIDFKRLRLGRR